jgi:hypothetical protein
MFKSFLITLLLFCVFLSAPSAASGTHDYSFKVSRGDAFYKFFFSTGLSGKLLKKLMASDERAQRLNNIYPGDKLMITLYLSPLMANLLIMEKPASSQLGNYLKP